MTETALIVIPEEVELLLPLVREAKTPTTHLLTYAAPVTRRMLHFNNLKYYAVPSLPAEWKASTWLMIELGIFTGRLYFEYEEYGGLREYLGLGPLPTRLGGEADDCAPAAEIDSGGIDGRVGNPAQKRGTGLGALQAQHFIPKPLTFLHEWLAVRRRGQDFVHTPMGYVCQGKALNASHPFFARPESNTMPQTCEADIEDGLGKGEASKCGVDEDFEFIDEDYEASNGYDGTEG